jgi:hypothetical protein
LVKVGRRLLGVLPWVVVACCIAPLRADAPSLYQQNFESLAEGKPPEDLLILAGSFQIKAVEGNKVLALDPNPLDTFGALFGPAERDAYTVSARILASNTGKRFPEFGVAALGPNGYKLWVMPATGQLQLKVADELLTHVPFEWKGGAWTRLKLSLSKSADGKVKLAAKAWADGAEEPKEWTITGQHEQAPKPGRAVIWAVPYGGTVTYFDDLMVTAGQ